MSDYDKGYSDGKHDALHFFPAQASRVWKRAYRDGYSDGYFDHSKQEKAY